MKSGTIALALTSILLAASAHAGLFGGKVAPVNVDKKGVALHGYDAVSYFEPGKPMIGSEQFTVAAAGATWRFASAENKAKFAADPNKYMPQFGGYCAKAVSENDTVDIDPLSFKVVDGKLYLNYSAKIQKVWEQDIPGRIAKAEKFWPGLH
jgi:YHS domain-containing protein